MARPSRAIVEAARAVAQASERPHPDCKSWYKVGAVIYNRSRILAAKHNTLKTHPVLARFTEWPFMHGETHAILSRGIDNCEGFDMLVVRVCRDVFSSLTMAKPCKVCRKVIAEAGIKNVYYSDWEGYINALAPDGTSAGKWMPTCLS